MPIPTNETYDPSLNKLNDVHRLIHYIDSVYATDRIEKKDTLDFVLKAAEILKNRFHYGFSNYSLANNWPAYFGGKVIWSHLSAIVEPNDILKRSYGLCSQQTIVFLAILQQKGIRFRSVGLGPNEGPGHFLCEVYYNGDWHIYDITMEPNWLAVKNSHKSMEYYLRNKDTLALIYKDKIPSEVLAKMFVEINYGKVNNMPATNMLLFHNLCKVIIYLIPILLLMIIVRNIYRTISSKS